MADKDTKNAQANAEVAQNPDANVEPAQGAPLSGEALQKVIELDRLTRARDAKREIDAILQKSKCVLTAEAYIDKDGRVRAIASIKAI